MKTILAALVAMSIVAAQAEPAASAEKTVSIVLVHGAFVDASGWKATYDILSDAGYQVLVVQQPTISLRDDVAETERVIAKARHPVILVGHSYGGMVITEAGDNPKVRSLVYLAAFCARWSARSYSAVFWSVTSANIPLSWSGVFCPSTCERVRMRTHRTSSRGSTMRMSATADRRPFNVPRSAAAAMERSSGWTVARNVSRVRGVFAGRPNIARQCSVAHKLVGLSIDMP